MKNILFILFSILIYSGSVSGQELNCQVSVNHSQVQTTDVRVFQTLQKAIFEFMNNRRWTQRVFKTEERIECSIFINIKTKNGDQYSASIQVQSRRPVFNTSYNSVMINYLDNDFNFEYVEYSPLDFQINSYQSNLTSVLAFYAYIILGMDFDSYGDHGGSSYFNNAQTIVNNAQNSNQPGWKSFESQKNRYWMIENILNGSYDNYRTFLYRYHRLGLDLMYDKQSKARTEILNTLQLLTKVHRTRPGLYILNLLMDAKRDEFIDIFSEAPPNEKATARNYLSEIDPSHSSEYQKMASGNTGGR
jgi:hypothetical protein